MAPTQGVKFTTLTDKKAVLEVRDCDQALMNGLRRVIIAETPYVALSQDGFTFRTNTGVLHNHFLAHRLTLVPIHASRGEADAYVPGSIEVSLKIQNDGERPMDVTSRDFQVTLHDQPHPDRDRLYPADPDTGDHVLLTVLKPGEAIDVKGVVVKGTGSDHAAFAVASTVAFRPLLDDTLIAERQATVPAGDLQAQNRFDYIDKKRCWRPGPDGNPRDFELTVVSESGLSAVDIIQSALDVLERKCTAVQGALTPGAVAQIEVLGEGDTLARLLQSAAMDELAGDDKPLKFVGCYCPHPLEKRVVFKLKADDPAASFEAMKQLALERVKSLAHEVSEAAARAALVDKKKGPA